MSVAIETSALSKVFRNGRQAVTAVDELNLAVPAGQIFGFLGPNGAGKTTTVKIICGLVSPTAGRVVVNGHDVARQRRAAMCQIGAVLEGTRNVYWRLSAWQNLMYFGRLKGRRAGLRKRARQLLTDLGLWARRDDEVRDFSRGMQQKVAIACALIADPPILLLDEPTLGLDVHASRTLKNWIQELATEEKKTIVLTTHQLDVAQELCHQVAIINHGRLIANQPTHELLRLFRKQYYQIRLAGYLPELEQAWPEGLAVAQENGFTILTGAIVKQEDLYAILDSVRALGLPLISAEQIEANLEEVFMELVGDGR
jgi:ABC-2 type transport system ATP-binding protein